MQFESSEALCEYVSELTGGVAILSFSTGKDSVMAWLQMKRFFKKIVPYYLYSVPGLSFVEKSLSYYEDFFQTRIIRLPQPSLYRILNNLVFQSPENCSIVEHADLPDFEREEIAQIIREDCGLPGNTYVGVGVRAVDSINRWASIKKYGPLNEKKLNFFPVYDFRKDRMVNELRAAKIKLPVDYRLFGRTFDGIDYRFLKPLKEYYPEDFEKILKMFPLAELELKRIEYREQYYKELENA